MADPGPAPSEAYLFGSDGKGGGLIPFAGASGQSGASYFRRRAAEARRAADMAAGPQARAAHREMAARYARLSGRTMLHGRLVPRHSASAERLRLGNLLRERFGLFGRPIQQDKARPDIRAETGQRHGQ
jgi:hypothetical protein